MIAIFSGQVRQTGTRNSSYSEGVLLLISKSPAIDVSTVESVTRLTSSTEEEDEEE